MIYIEAPWIFPIGPIWALLQHGKKIDKPQCYDHFKAFAQLKTKSSWPGPKLFGQLLLWTISLNYIIAKYDIIYVQDWL